MKNAGREALWTLSDYLPQQVGNPYQRMKYITKPLTTTTLKDKLVPKPFQKSSLRW